MNEYRLDSAQYAGFEQGAMLLAILAFPGPKEVSLRHAAAVALCEDAFRAACKADPDQADEWRDAFPAYGASAVIHIAAAMHIMLQLLGRNEDSERVSYPIHDGGLHREVAALAEFHEAIVLADPRFGVKPDQLIRLRYR